ncbi:hypothetical protein QQS21_009113 [Conoideocrella luteorostrata]|uniref:ABC transporter n=1 Tax=Conoideocrella luteorostrata TaxID=1105319 RepID=A0AAJ0CHQ8_9HYPO|nr:hypothetical protein QQS21_009113 [Conoideocrella luteorostrata]
MLDIAWRAIGIAGDDAFGPQLSPQFDFTLLFEFTILTIIPASLLIVISPFYLLYYLKSPAYVSGSALSWFKLIASGTLLGVEIASLASWATVTAYRSDVSLAALSLDCVAAIFIVALINFEHRHSLRSSAFISLYLGLTLLLDVVKARSYLSRPGLRAAAGLCTSKAVVKLIVLILQEVPKRRPVQSTTLSKEVTSGFWNRSLFIWLNPTLLFGFGHILKDNDLGDLGDEFASESLSARFDPVWKRCFQNELLGRSAPLQKMHELIIDNRLAQKKSADKSFIRNAQMAISLGHISKTSAYVRNGLIGATVLIYLGIAITKAAFKHITYRVITRLRGILVTKILTKTLSIGLFDVDKLAAVTLMSTDIEGLVTGLPNFHEIWASLIEFGLGVYFLSTIIGAATFLIIVPAVVATVASFMIGKRLSPARVQWNKAVQQRVATTSSILAQVKSIRMIGLKSVAMDIIQSLRESEMAFSKDFRVLFVILKSAGEKSHVQVTPTSNANAVSVILCYSLTPILIVTAALFWTKFTQGLRADEIYTTLAFLVLTISPLHRLMVSYSLFTSIIGCFQRIETYLLSKERQDERETISDLVIRNSSEEIESEKLGATKSSVRPSNKPSIEFQLPQPPIVLVDVSIAPLQDKDPVLKGVSLSVFRSEISFVFGRTGSGKSIFLRSLLGETHLVSGLVYVEQRHIAFCDEVPWLKATTISNNIIGDYKYDRDWYDTVVEACLLSQDILELPEGDLTNAGNNGANLSGGQRQRALARAIYSRAPLLVLDNIFSSLDRSTADTIFTRLFSPTGLFKRFGCTVVMAMRTAEHIEYADRIITIETDGSVRCLANVKDAQTIKVVLEEFTGAGRTESGPDIEHPTAIEEVSTQNDLIPNEPLFTRQRGDFGLYRYYLASTTTWNWAAWLVTMMFAALTEKLPDIFIRIWLEVAPTNKVYLAGYVAVGLSNFVSSALTLAVYYIKIVPDSSETLHRRLLGAVMGSTLSHLSTTSSAALLNLFSQDMSLVSQDLPLAFYLFVYTGFLLIIDIGVISSGATYVAVIIPFIFACLYTIQYFYLRTSRQIRHLDLEAKTPLYAQFTEITSGILHIRSFGWQGNYLSRGLSLLDYSQKPFYYMFCVQRWLNLVIELSVLGVATVLVSAALYARGTTQSSIGLAMLNLISFGESISAFIEMWINLETSLGAISRIRAYSQDTPIEDDGDTSPLPPGCLKQGAINFEEVTAMYRLSSSMPKIALEGVNLNIQPGQKVAVIGRTGSGKSSLLLTLLNFLEYTGSIKIDGVELSQIPREQLRSSITTIPQDFVQLPGSLRFNLLPLTKAKTADPLHDIVINEVLDRLGLAEFIESRGGLDADLSEIGFSHGQRQLLAIARAVLHKFQHDTNILFIDEATSSIDAETAEAMERILDEVFSNCTIISISHRPEIVASADLVVKMDSGRVASIVQGQGRRDLS